jgi:inhibitor of KinA
MREYVPAYTTITVYYDPCTTSLDDICTRLEQLNATGSAAPELPQRTVEVPVCYGGSFGEDLDFVARHHGLTADEVVAIHTAGEYVVHLIGFAPGFPYLGGMSQRIATPRRSEPRLSVPAGTVGIAGTQTGIYSIPTPGGWQLIGRTPVALFRPWDDPPSLLRAGDAVRFRAIGEDEYRTLQLETA